MPAPHAGNGPGGSPGRSRHSRPAPPRAARAPQPRPRVHVRVRVCLRARPGRYVLLCVLTPACACGPTRAPPRSGSRAGPGALRRPRAPPHRPRKPGHRPGPRLSALPRHSGTQTTAPRGWALGSQCGKVAQQTPSLLSCPVRCRWVCHWKPPEPGAGGDTVRSLPSAALEFFFLPRLCGRVVYRYLVWELLPVACVLIHVSGVWVVAALVSGPGLTRFFG